MKKILTFWIFIAVLLTCTASELISLESDREIILTDRDRWDRGEKSMAREHCENNESSSLRGRRVWNG